ncbi:MAG: sugar phosphorylase [Anaerolineales bacterium]
MTPEQRIRELLNDLYGAEKGETVWIELIDILDKYRYLERRIQNNTSLAEKIFSEKDAILITYGDQVQEKNTKPLRTLAGFLQAEFRNVISGIHILPFFPYSSDDGFSVIDFRLVNPEYGDWEDIDQIGHGFRLMYDAVINHISRESDWSKSFLLCQEPFFDYFTTVDPEVDLSMVFRPRALPLLTPVETTCGEKWVWTTFSDDQFDLNYSNPKVLLEIIDLLLFYVSRGAEIIRLDAIAYLWKEIGTSCMHLPQTHAVIKIWRAVLDMIAPWVVLITETNVPHEENISYYGQFLPETGRTDEAQMVYQFPLAPLILHTFLEGEVCKLRSWADNLYSPGPFFNFIASHDGIGVMPAKGILDEVEIQALVDQTLAHGGRVSYKSNQDGSKSVYELNITLYDWLNGPVDEQVDLEVSRFLASQAIMLSLAGVPGIYFHSLFGARNCYKCVEQTGRARSINREKFFLEELTTSLDDLNSRTARIFNGYLTLLKRRREHKAFHPESQQKVLFIDNNIFSLYRGSTKDKEVILCLINVSEKSKKISINPLEFDLPINGQWRDILGDEVIQVRKNMNIYVSLEPYQTMWLLNYQA